MTRATSPHHVRHLVICPGCGRKVGSVYPSKTVPAAHKDSTGSPCSRRRKVEQVNVEIPPVGRLEAENPGSAASGNLEAGK